MEYAFTFSRYVSSGIKVENFHEPPHEGHNRYRKKLWVIKPTIESLLVFRAIYLFIVATHAGRKKVVETEIARK